MFHFLTMQRFGGDAFWHLLTGLHILHSGHVPTTDPYSWTMHGHSWVAQEWGYEVLLALAYRIAHFQGIFLLSLAFAAGLFLTLLVLWRLRGASLAQAAVLLMLLAFAAARSVYRAGIVLVLEVLHTFDRVLFRAGK